MGLARVLEELLLGKGDVPAIPDDEMVEDLDAEDLPGLLEARGDGFRVPGRLTERTRRRRCTGADRRRGLGRDTSVGFCGRF